MCIYPTEKLSTDKQIAFLDGIFFKEKLSKMKQKIWECVKIGHYENYTIDRFKNRGWYCWNLKRENLQQLF